MAWKNGVFSFKDADTESIMREVSRWYSIDVVFEQPVEEKFYADVSRNTSVSTLLQMLETTKAVHFKIEEKTTSIGPLSKWFVAHRSSAIDVPDFTQGARKKNKPVDLPIDHGNLTPVRQVSKWTILLI